MLVVQMQEQVALVFPHQSQERLPFMLVVEVVVVVVLAARAVMAAAVEAEQTLKLVLLEL